MKLWAKLLVLSSLMVLLSGMVERAYAAAPDCSAYTVNTEPYFNCIIQGGASTASTTDSCVEISDSRFPENVVYLPSYNTTYVPNVTRKFIGLVKDGASLECPENQPGGVPFWQVGSPNEGKIVVNYAPCNGTLTPNDSFLDHLDCNPTGKDADAFDDLDNNSNRKSPVSLTLAPGDCQKAHNVTFCAELDNDLICAFVPNGINKIYIGCNTITPTSASVPPPSLACFVPNLCWDKNAVHGISKNPTGFSISGAVALCIEGAVDKIFFSGWDPAVDNKLDIYGTFGTGGASCPTTSMFYKVQQSFRAIVIGAITLWIVFWGLRVIASGAPPQRGEFIRNVVTLAIVMYFTLGAGWVEYLPLLRQLISGLSGAMLNAVTADDNLSTLCVFNQSQYPPGFGTMALWDTFDCKIFSYFFSEKTYPKFLEVAVISVVTGGFGYGLIILVMAILFAFFMAGLIIYTVEIYVVSMIVIAFLVFLSPLFIPMALFNYTKGYFKAWLGELISVSLYPIILFGFVALMLATFDLAYYGDCQDPGANCVYLPFGTATVHSEKDSMGSVLREAVVDWSSASVDKFSVDIFFFDLLKVCFFAYLFFRFMMILGPFIGELVGTAKSDLGTIGGDTGKKVMGKGFDTAEKAARVGLAAAKGAARGMVMGGPKAAAAEAGKAAAQEGGKIAQEEMQKKQDEKSGNVPDEPKSTSTATATGNKKDDKNV